MQACIYYDLETVTAADVAAAQMLAAEAPEFVAGGAGWPAEVAGPAPQELLNSREFQYQDDLMLWVNRLLKEVAERWNAGGELLASEAELLEVARFGIFFEFAAVEQRWRAFCDLMHKQSPERVVWVADASRRKDLRRLAAAVAPTRFEFVESPQSIRGVPRLLRNGRAAVRSLLGRFARRAIQWLPRVAIAGEIASAPLVVVEYYPNSAKVLVPVVRRLREQYGIQTKWLAGRPAVGRALKAVGVESIALADIAPRTSRRRSEMPPAVRRRLLEALAALPNDLYEGTGGANGKAYLLPAMQASLPRVLNESHYWLAAFSEAFGNIQPACVASTTYSSVVGRAAAAAARDMHASTVFVQHGLFPDCRHFAHFCHDYLLMWGESNRRTLVASGIAPQRIGVIGSTIYDDLVGCLRQRAARDFPAVGQPLKIAYMASRTAGLVVTRTAAQHCLLSVLEAVRRTADANLAIKVHPGDRTGFVANTVGRRGAVEVIEQGSSQAVTRDSDVVIVVSSTTGLEACMADKPLIALRVAGVSDWVSYQEYGAAVEISLDEPDAAGRLAEAIESLRRDPARRAELADGRRRLIADMLNGGRGDAAQQAARFIADLTKRSIPIPAIADAAR